MPTLYLALNNLCVPFRSMTTRNQCPVCWWSVRSEGGRVVQHDRDAFGQPERCPGSQKPTPA